MLACTLLTTASLLGWMLALGIGVSIGPWTRLALGVALGQLFLLWLPFGVAVSFDLGAQDAGFVSLVLLLLASAVAAAGLRRSSAVMCWTREVGASVRSADCRVTATLALSLLALLGYLLHTHYLAPRPDGMHSAGVTWGDLPLHLAFATRVLYAQGRIPIEHPLYLHGPLSYPFLPDYSVAVLSALGLPLRWAFILGGLVPLAALPALLYGTARLWLGESRRAASALSVALFFFAGGLGFVFVLRSLGSGEPLLDVLASTNATYIDPWVLKSSQIGNLFIAARSAAYGMPLAAAALLLLGHAVDDPSHPQAPWLLGAALVGALPLIHGHSFLAAGCALGFYSWLVLREGRAVVFRGFALFALLALPQLAWLFSQGAPSALRVAFGMLRPADGLWSWLRDVLLDLGFWAFLVPIAYFVAPARARRLSLPLLLLLPLANVVCFTPTRYDNVKLLSWFDFAAAPLVAALLVRIASSNAGSNACSAQEWNGPRTGAGGDLSGASRGERSSALCHGAANLDHSHGQSHFLLGRGPLGACLLGLGCTLSGLLAVAHELTNDALVISYPEANFADFVRTHTPPAAVVATAASYHDPVAMLSGRRVPIATPAMLNTHGIDVAQRVRDLVTFYRGGPAALEVQQRLGIDAAVVGSHERHDLPWLNEAFLQARASASFEHAAGRLYLLRPAPKGVSSTSARSHLGRFHAVFPAKCSK